MGYNGDNDDEKPTRTYNGKTHFSFGNEGTEAGASDPITIAYKELYGLREGSKPRIDNKDADIQAAALKKAQDSYNQYTEFLKTPAAQTLTVDEIRSQVLNTIRQDMLDDKKEHPEKSGDEYKYAMAILNRSFEIFDCQRDHADTPIAIVAQPGLPDASIWEILEPSHDYVERVFNSPDGAFVRNVPDPVTGSDKLEEVGHQLKHTGSEIVSTVINLAIGEVVLRGTTWAYNSARRNKRNAAAQERLANALGQLKDYNTNAPYSEAFMENYVAQNYPETSGTDPKNVAIRKSVANALSHLPDWAQVSIVENDLHTGPITRQGTTPTDRQGLSEFSGWLKDAGQDVNNATKIGDRETFSEMFSQYVLSTLENPNDPEKAQKAFKKAYPKLAETWKKQIIPAVEAHADQLMAQRITAINTAIETQKSSTNPPLSEEEIQVRREQLKTMLTSEIASSWSQLNGQQQQQMGPGSDAYIQHQQELQNQMLQAANAKRNAVNNDGSQSQSTEQQQQQGILNFWKSKDNKQPNSNAGPTVDNPIGSYDTPGRPIYDPGTGQTYQGRYKGEQQDRNFVRTVDGMNVTQAKSVIKTAMSNANQATRNENSGSTGSLATLLGVANNQSASVEPVIDGSKTTNKITPPVTIVTTPPLNSSSSTQTNPSTQGQGEQTSGTSPVANEISSGNSTGLPPQPPSTGDVGPEPSGNSGSTGGRVGNVGVNGFMMVTGISQFRNGYEQFEKDKLSGALNMGTGMITTGMGGINTLETLVPGTIKKVAGELGLKYLEDANLATMLVSSAVVIATADPDKKGIEAMKLAASFAASHLAGAAFAGGSTAAVVDGTAAIEGGTAVVAEGAAGATFASVCVPFAVAMAAGWTFDRALNMQAMVNQHDVMMRNVAPDAAHSHLNNEDKDNLGYLQKIQNTMQTAAFVDQYMAKGSDGKIDFNDPNNLAVIKATLTPEAWTQIETACTAQAEEMDKVLQKEKHYKPEMKTNLIASLEQSSLQAMLGQYEATLEFRDQFFPIGDPQLTVKNGKIDLQNNFNLLTILNRMYDAAGVKADDGKTSTGDYFVSYDGFTKLSNRLANEEEGKKLAAAIAELQQIRLGMAPNAMVDKPLEETQAIINDLKEKAITMARANKAIGGSQNIMQEFVCLAAVNDKGEVEAITNGSLRNEPIPATIMEDYRNLRAAHPHAKEIAINQVLTKPDANGVQVPFKLVVWHIMDSKAIQADRAAKGLEPLDLTSGNTDNDMSVLKDVSTLPTNGEKLARLIDQSPLMTDPTLKQKIAKEAQNLIAYYTQEGDHMVDSKELHTIITQLNKEMDLKKAGIAFDDTHPTLTLTLRNQQTNKINGR